MKLRLAKRYARALFQAAEEQQLVSQTGEELSLVEQAFADSGVRAFFMNPGVTAADKKAAVDRLFGAGVSTFAQSFLLHMVEKRRINVLPEVIAAYQVLVKQAANIITVEVTSATALDAQDQELLVAQLAGVTGKTIELCTRVDKRILGGLILAIGDKRIDNSVLARLATMKNQLLSKSFESEVKSSL